MGNALNIWHHYIIMASIESEEITEPVVSNTETIQEVKEDTTLDQEESPELD